MLLQAKPFPLSRFGFRLPLRWYKRLTLATAFSIWMLIVLGGMVRVTESGRGCGDSWPMCNGHLFPSFEYHELVEWNHRLFATLVGGLMILTIGSTVLWYRKPRRVLFMALLAGLTYVAQAVLGGITVLLHLDHTWVAAHMGNSMLLMASVVLLAFFARESELGTGERNKTLRYLSLGVLVWTYIALFTGSAVIGNNADLACPEWPQCSASNPLPDNWPEWVNFGHRLAVGFSDVLMLALGVLVLRSSRRTDGRVIWTGRLLAGLYISQVFLGAFTIWLGAPSYLKGAHLALAAATWAILVLTTTFIWVGPAVSKVNGGPSGGNVARKFRLTRAVRRTKLAPEVVRNYLKLMRFNVIPLLLVPTIASMLIAAVQFPPQRSLLELILLTALGGVLATGGAHTINQYLDRDLDARMKRTKLRVIVTGKVSPQKALAFGIFLTAAGVIQLGLTVNFLAAALSLGGNLFYVFVYTIWLKRTSPQNIVIGGAAGAVPPLVGWAAVTGSIGLPALLFFAIIFFWTPAHFWALSLVRQEEYRAAGVPMLPVVKGEAAARAGIMQYSLMLVAVTMLPFLVHALSWLYLATALVLGFIFVRKALILARTASIPGAWKLFKFSNTYLALLYLVMVLDRLLALGGTA